MRLGLVILVIGTGLGLVGPSLAGVPAAPPTALPPYLPRYRVEMEYDVKALLARVRQEATWTNPGRTPTDRLVFNVHSRYLVPAGQIGFMAKMLEILRVQPSEAIYKQAPCEIREVTLPGPAGAPGIPLKFHFDGETETTMVVPLPRMVAPGESITVHIDLLFHVPAKQGRWGCWDGITTLSNWLPVFAYYGPKHFGPRPPGDYEACPPVGRGTAPRPVRDQVEKEDAWKPVPFIAWHQPYFNESALYFIDMVLPRDQVVTSSGVLRRCEDLSDGRKRVIIEALGVRDFTLVCSNRFRCFEGSANAGPGGAPVRVRVAAFPEHEFYAQHMVRIASDALTAYSRWFGPYPWPEFTVSESYFGWNGNECSALVMIDQRVFAMPHVAVGYVEYLLSHEVCHQWWYNLVGSNGYCETWMDEGLANYFSHRLLTLKFGKNNALMSYPAALEWLPNIRRDDYRSCGMYSTIGKGEMGPVIQEMNRFGHLANLFNTCYDKGGRLVGMIEERLGEAAFFDFIRGIYRKYGYRILSVADFQRELEEYTGRSWEEFFRRWLYECGISDWAVEKVGVTKAPKCAADHPRCCLMQKRFLFARGARSELPEIPPGGVRLTVVVHQKAEYDEPTTLGIAMEDSEKFSIRIPIVPGAQEYSVEDPPAQVIPLEPGPKGGARFRVEVVLPAKPCQVAIDPDQVLVDAEPANNFWHQPVRWRITPLYTFLEETDLTTAYDRWNILLGPWLYTPTFATTWFNRSTMVGARAGVYRTQQFAGGVYAGYRTNWRDIVVGVDGQWEHWPFPKSQTGFVAERRLMDLEQGDQNATRGVLWTRYIFAYNASLYLPPIHYVETFAQYSDNFLPYPTQAVPGSIRYDRTSTLGLHYYLNYLTPYWDPEGGFAFNAWYEGGIAEKPSSVGLQKIGGSFSMVKSPPQWFTDVLPAPSGIRAWIGDTRFAIRLYGATAAPSRGEFFTMGGSDLFRGFDLAQRQGSTVWVGSAEWRFPLARHTQIDCLDHVASVRNINAVAFYDVGDVYANGNAVGPIAHAIGAGLRLDVSWFSFVERTTLRFDIAKAINGDTGPQLWLGINHPF
ncbi:MAG: M1 family aminopeptidase [Gemmataceae bacterium]